MKIMTGKFVVGIVDRPTVNGRIYPREEMEKAIKAYQQTIKEGRALGTLWPKDYDDCEELAPNINNASHQVTGLKIEGDEVVMEMKTLATPQGKLLCELMDAQLAEFTTCGIANLTPDNKTVTEFKLLQVTAVQIS